MMEKIKIAGISYLNTLPFFYGIEHSDYLKDKIEIVVDNPSASADMLLKKEVDIALVPVAIIPDLKISYIISKFCIGANNNVKSVLLVSDVPLNEIRSIYLDDQSRTSVCLVRVLAKYYWKITPNFIPPVKNYEKLIIGSHAGVIIGDRALKLNRPYKYVYDLAGEWISFTKLPFVFACWISVKSINEEFKTEFNKALQTGIDNIPKVVEHYSERAEKLDVDLSDYFTNNISYDLSDKKIKGMNLFLKYAQELKWKEDI